MLPDLQDVEKRLAASRKLFLDCVGSYNDAAADDGQFIIDKFLNRFAEQQPGRSKLSQTEAAETTRLIKEFGEVRTRFIEHVAILNLSMNQELIGLMIRALKIPDETLKHANAEVSPTETPLDQLKRFRGAFEKMGDVLNAEIIAGTEKAVNLADYVINVQNSAAALIKNREHTLTGYKEDHFDWDWHKVPKRMFGEIKGEGAWEIATETAVKVAHIGSEVVPFGVFWHGALAVYRGATPEQHKAKPGDTDLMQILLEQLRDESATFKALDDMYNMAQDKITSIGSSQ